MEFYVLASGSKGNCTVVKSSQTMLIIDCGMSWAYLSQAFGEHNIDYNKADALLISHQHSDHVAQIEKFKGVKKYSCSPIKNCELSSFYQEFKVQDFSVMALPLSHDSINTSGFVIKNKKEKLVYITDTGYLSEKNLFYLENADYYIFESNHNVTMLLNTKRPIMLKRRIMHLDGHLSNEDCAAYLSQLVGDKTKEIVLAHLSQEANHPAIALKTLQEVFLANEIDYTNIKITTAQQSRTYKGGRL